MSSILIVLVMVPYKEIMFLAKACDAVLLLTAVCARICEESPI